MAIDNEYATMNVCEMQELRVRGIRYDFVKKIDGRSVWKYKKTPQLFEALKDYYKNGSKIVR